MAAVTGLALGDRVWAQAIPRDRYLYFLPLSHAKLVPQTEASSALHLFGDATAPSYRDQDPFRWRG